MGMFTPDQLAALGVDQDIQTLEPVPGVTVNGKLEDNPVGHSVPLADQLNLGGAPRRGRKATARKGSANSRPRPANGATVKAGRQQLEELLAQAFRPENPNRTLAQAMGDEG